MKKAAGMFYQMELKGVMVSFGDFGAREGMKSWPVIQHDAGPEKGFNLQWDFKYFHLENCESETYCKSDCCKFVMLIGRDLLTPIDDRVMMHHASRTIVKSIVN